MRQLRRPSLRRSEWKRKRKQTPGQGPAAATVLSILPRLPVSGSVLEILRRGDMKDSRTG
jgi:hypothetical protein